jgi:hypothetical protein
VLAAMFFTFVATPLVAAAASMISRRPGRAARIGAGGCLRDAPADEQAMGQASTNCSAISHTASSSRLLLPACRPRWTALEQSCMLQPGVGPPHLNCCSGQAGAKPQPLFRSSPQYIAVWPATGSASRRGVEAARDCSPRLSAERFVDAARPSFYNDRESQSEKR